MSSKLGEKYISIFIFFYFYFYVCYNMVEWHHQLGGHESEQALGADDGQESLGCCSPWGH